MEKDHMPFDVFTLTSRVGVVRRAVLNGGGLA